MKKFLLLFIFLFYSLTSFSQVYTGGNVGVSYNNGLFVDISPIIGYKIDKINVGGGPVISYSEALNSPPRFSFGAKGLGQYSITDAIFTHAELNILNVPDLTAGELVNRKWILSLPIGAGYQYEIAPGAVFQAMVLYDVLLSEDSPNRNPMVRVGVNYSLGK